ncbi:helix-turn-helix domain-containing protein [Acinetobacter nosocomialis]|uniref:helix-turn-helix domain-containing protein n=1 Tax=Acinetobacter TaxID=469 RepID=UPI0022EB1837|nr:MULTISPECIES: helix-turn-helix domain-containing protein [Acinetobacter]MDA3464549.1 helix-turn-helix domain-containing protein [Acinetobacter sp. AOR41_HL]MDR9576654.1 helix-turn-helix domain-containing protein [Acinetobacter nosocomialis]
MVWVKVKPFTDSLLAQNLNLGQVAEILGFSDLSTFSQAYKRWTGVAPSHYKKQMIK